MKCLSTSYLIVVLLIFFGFSQARAQTTFATETFGTGAATGTLANGFVGDMGAWSVSSTGANGANGNIWYVSGEECGTAVGNCGFGCPGGNNTLHISAIGGLCGVPDCGAAYDATNASNITNLRAESPTIDCTGKANIVLNFDYIAAQGDDGFWVEYSLDNGATWTTFVGGNVAESGCCCIFPGFCTNPTDPTPCSDAFSAQGYWSAMSLNFPAGADNNPNVKIAFHWSNDGNGVGTDPSVAIDNIDITNDIVLPVELVDFKGISEGSVNQLFWTTKSELNNAYFEVQHSINGVDYEQIGTVYGQGNSSVSINYYYRHITESKINYYRLKQVDYDGKYKFSNRIEIENDLSGIVLFQRENEILISGLSKYNGLISILDATGKLKLKSYPYNYTIDEVSIPTSSLNKGLYIITAEGSNGKKVFKVIL